MHETGTMAWDSIKSCNAMLDPIIGIHFVLGFAFHFSPLASFVEHAEDGWHHFLLIVMLLITLPSYLTGC